jgi:hypothetical protein
MNYEFSTPEANYEFAVNPNNTDNVFVYAQHKEDLETVLNSLELAGVQEGRYFEDLLIEDTENPPTAQRIHFIEITRADLALYLQFEVLNYLGVDTLL